ncbi:hypothetical protein [Arcanobacterium canis]
MPVAIGSITALVTIFAILLGAMNLNAQVTRMRNAADLAAISAAQILHNSASASAACAWVDEQMKDYDTRCVIEGDVVSVQSQLPSGWARLTGILKTEAVAGPDDAAAQGSTSR